MPELPEVETVRRGLLPLVESQVIERAVQNRLDLRWPLPPRFAARLTGRRVEAIRRRAKYLLLDLDPGPKTTQSPAIAETLLIHLGMSGRLLLSGGDAARIPTAQFHHAVGAENGEGKHDHVVLDMTGGVRVVFNDARRFGAMDLWPTESLDTHPLLEKLGPEPLSNSFGMNTLLEGFAGRRTSLKAALLDQRIVAGLGNIYVCEALYRARLSPTRHAGTLAEAEADRLAGAIRDVLGEAIEAGGSSLRDFHGASGELGYFQHSFSVYDREGAPCRTPNCTAEIERLVQNARSTFFCPRCQQCDKA